MIATSKHGGMGRARTEPDLTTYSGRIAARVRVLRERKGFSVDELAAKVGIGVPTLYGYESGKRDIPTDLLPDLADALGVAVRTLMPDC